MSSPSPVRSVRPCSAVRHSFCLDKAEVSFRAGLRAVPSFSFLSSPREGLPTIHELGLPPDHKSGDRHSIGEGTISRAFVERSQEFRRTVGDPA